MDALLCFVSHSATCNTSGRASTVILKPCLGQQWDYIAQAIKLAQHLGSVVIKVVALEKEMKDFESSHEYMKDVLGFFNEALEADIPATDLLTQMDQLLYALMDYEPVGEGWHDEDEYKTKEIMKLKEILPAAAA